MQPVCHFFPDPQINANMMHFVDREGGSSFSAVPSDVVNQSSDDSNWPPDRQHL